MTAEIICGKLLAESLYKTLSEKLEILKDKYSLIPGLAVIRVGDDHASGIYVENKIKACAKLGIHSFKFEYEADIHQHILLKKIDSLNHDPRIHAILVQLPMPAGLDIYKIIEAVSPLKDVDGFHPQNIGKLAMGVNGMVPCTPLGCLHMIKSVCKVIEGKHAVVIGRSNIVGRPMGQLLLNNNCTVTMCHSYTKNLQEITSMADILIVATGKMEFLSADHIKKGAIVIDVGINRNEHNKLTGDVKFLEAKKVAGFITPVPGGVGPMTIAYLMHNTIKAACVSKHICFETMRLQHHPL